ncbi:MAG: divalent-cation tolerance protein CutA [Candidatus Aenigmarchaeota archaeon]|nr:divalent-cation tolerance protein CutA [Candidatus Aenigmarchaeota archaeon]
MKNGRISVYIIVPSEPEASKIAESLVESRLAACVNFFPVKSVYRWEGRIIRQGEYALIAKTRHSLLPALKDKVASMHPDAVPCITAWQISGGNEEYLKWVDEETSYGK